MAFTLLIKMKHLIPAADAKRARRTVASIIQLIVSRLTLLPVRDPGQMKKDIHSLQQLTSGITCGQIQCHRWLPTIQWRAVFAQCNDRVTASCKLLAELATDESGSTAD